MADNLFFGKDATERLMNGVKKAADVVASTMGTSGSNSLIQCIERPHHYATNDGITILESIKFEDPLEEMGRQVLYEAVSRANRQSGDGSSTTTVICASILEQGLKNLETISPLELKKSLEDCIPIIEESIKKQTKKIEINEVGKVASISAEDEGIGQRIQEIYEKIGKDGIINWDVSKTTEDSYEVGTGIKIFDATYATSYMCDMDSKQRFLSYAILNNPHVLLAKKKITATELDPICKQLYEMGQREFLIFTEEMDVDVLSGLLNLQMKNGFRTVVVKMPVIWRNEWWEDLAIASGGKIIDNVSYKTEFAKLGAFGRVKVGKEETIIEGTQDLSQHILALKVDGSDEALQRVARLNVQTARYFVGARSETALAYRRLKVEDAINASSCALENGVVVGGGIALVNTAEELPDTLGGKILQEALSAPFIAIVKNTGKQNEIDGETGVGGEIGFNSKTGKVENLMDSGVVDASDVVLSAVKNAIGVAATILTINSVITFPKVSKENQPNVPV